MPENAQSSAGSMRVALISTPWALLNRPSVQLGALQAYLREKSDIAVRSLHFYLNVAKLLGPEAYHQLALSGWAGEALFAGQIFPEREASARQVFCRTAHQSHLSQDAFAEWLEKLQDLCRSWVAAQEFAACDLVGFSVCFNQLFASLYLARLIKEIAPETPIVFGGSGCSGEVGRSLFSVFPEIDYLIDGEGEEQLLHLCRQLSREKYVKPREGAAETTTTPLGPSPPTRLVLNKLPIPDYADYFRQTAAIFGPNHFIPTLPIEFSRGCLWNKCTFCNLNLQWQDYRYKSADRMFTEVKQLAAASETLNFTFTDNALPPAEADKFFRACDASGIDFDFFGEIRATISRKKLAGLRKGGLQTVQIGIEAMSSSLLRKMNKGTTVMDNIAVMKNCLAYDIHMEGNLITEFPSASEAEIEETLRNLDFVLPYAPLRPATFFLGHGSPIFMQTKQYGIRSVLAHNNYKKLLPANLLARLQLMVCDYRGDRGQQRRLWHPVRAKLKRWQDFQTARSHKRRCALSSRDGQTFLVIEQELPGAPTLQHRLRGTSREIYLFCKTPRSTGEILRQHPKVTADNLRQFVAMMTNKKLMYQEEDKVLSLALPDS